MTNGYKPIKVVPPFARFSECRVLRCAMWASSSGQRRAPLWSRTESVPQKRFGFEFVVVVLARSLRLHSKCAQCALLSRAKNIAAQCCPTGSFCVSIAWDALSRPNTRLTIEFFIHSADRNDRRCIVYILAASSFPRARQIHSAGRTHSSVSLSSSSRPSNEEAMHVDEKDARSLELATRNDDDQPQQTGRSLACQPGRKWSAPIGALLGLLVGP